MGIQREFIRLRVSPREAYALTSSSYIHDFIGRGLDLCNNPLSKPLLLAPHFPPFDSALRQCLSLKITLVGLLN